MTLCVTSFTCISLGKSGRRYLCEIHYLKSVCKNYLSAVYSWPKNSHNYQKCSISILQKVDFLSLKILRFRILVPKIQQKLPNRYVAANCVTEFSYLATATSQIQCHNSRGIACLIFLEILLDYRCTVIGILILGNFHPLTSSVHWSTSM